MQGKMILSEEAIQLHMSNSSLSASLPVHKEYLANLLSNETWNHNDPDLAVFRFMFETILTLMVSMFGLAGNTASLGVLYRMKKKKLCSVATLLQILAVIDILLLLNNCALRPFRYILMNTGYISVHAYMFPFLYASTFTLSFINTWLTVILSWNRYQAVCNPLAVYTHPNSFSGSKNSYTQFAIVVVVAIIISMPRYFESKIVYVEIFKRHSFVMTDILNDKVYMIAYRSIIFTLCQYAIPIGLLIFFNFKIIYSLQNNSVARGGVNDRTSRKITIFVANQKMSNEECVKMNKMKKNKADKKGKGSSKKNRTRYKSLSESTTTTTASANQNVQPIQGPLYDPPKTVCVRNEPLIDDVDLLEANKDLNSIDRVNSAPSTTGVEAPKEIEKSDGKPSAVVYNSNNSKNQPFRPNVPVTAVIAVTRMVLVVVVMSTICSAFISIAHFLQMIQFTGSQYQLDMFRRYYTVLSNFLGTINHSFNFVAYCLSSKNFRIILYSSIQDSFSNVSKYLSGCCRRRGK